MSDSLFGIGAVLSGIGNAGSAVFNALSQQKTNEQNVALQREAWAREDSAVQRRAADLKAAGINPLLAAGQAAQAGPAVRMEAPRVERQAVSGLGDSLMELVRGSVSVSQTQAQTELIRQQNKNLETQGALLDFERQFAERTLDYRVGELAASVKSANASAALKEFERAWAGTVSSRPVSEVRNADGSFSLVPGAPVSKFAEMRDAELAKTKALSLASQYAPDQASQQLMATVIAVKSAGLQNQFLEQLSKTNPGLADGVRKWFDILGSGVGSVSKIGGMIP